MHGGVEGREEVERSGEVGRREEGRAREAMVEAVLLRLTCMVEVLVEVLVEGRVELN